MFLADTHSDTLFSLGVGKRTFAQTDITPDRLRQGGVSLQTLALWSGPKGPNGDYEAVADAEYAAIRHFTDAGIRQVDDPEDVKPGENTFMLSFEGCEVFQKSDEMVAFWRQRGIRIGALVWNHPNAFATPAAVDAETHMTPEGIRIARVMQRQGISVDVSHLNEAGFWDLFAKGERPPMASHSCCRALCDHVRNLTDDQIRAMIQYGGYIGVNFYPRFLSADCKADSVTIAQHIDHICQLGGSDIVGFGSDFDGIETTPVDCKSPADVPKILDELRRRVSENKVKDADTAKQMLKDIMIEQMDIPRPPLRWPMVMLVVGVNGAGKTTTIGKLALRFQNIGRRIILCAADTFRAAAADQLTVWAERARVPIVKHAEGADPAAVVYDGIQSAKAQGADLLIVDTAGRLHNKKNLMDELNKMRRVIDREFPEADVRCMLVLDATTGQNGLAQARAFKEVCEIGGIILTKLDGTAKGGIALAIRQELEVPVWYIGVGEGIDDLQPFNAKDFVEALF